MTEKEYQQKIERLEAMIISKNDTPLSFKWFHKLALQHKYAKEKDALEWAAT